MGLLQFLYSDLLQSDGIFASLEEQKATLNLYRQVLGPHVKINNLNATYRHCRKSQASLLRPVSLGLCYGLLKVYCVHL